MNTKTLNEQLFESHKGLIISIAKRFTGRGVSMEELFQIGCVGFLKAAEGFDFDYGTKFSTYAVPFITGELKRFFRDDGQIKVSRSIKTLYIKICAVRDSYIKNNGKEPCVSELAKLLETDEESISQAMLCANAVSSIYGEDGKISPAVLKIEDTGPDSICDRISLGEAMDSLSPKLRSVVEKRFFMHMTQAQVAKELDTSQVQVSRFEKKALAQLREALSEV